MLSSQWALVNSLVASLGTAVLYFFLFLKKQMVQQGISFRHKHKQCTTLKLKDVQEKKEQNKSVKKVAVRLFAVDVSVCPLGGAAPAADSQEGSQTPLGGGGRSNPVP